MFRLVESIKLLDGIMPDIAFHTARLNRSRKECFMANDSIDLADILDVPLEFRSGLYKLRVVYDREIRLVEYHPYTKRQIARIKLVDGGDLDYRYKYEDRHLLNDLFAQRGECDDVLIVKNGLVSDMSSSNAVFFDGQRWFTPDTPLLKGTKRERLLSEERIFEKRIVRADIAGYEKISLINAMVDLEEIVVDIANIVGLSGDGGEPQ